MVSLGLFLKGLPANFKCFLIFWIFQVFIRATPAVASPFYLDFYPQGYSLEIDEWAPTQRQLYLSDCTAEKGRVFNFTPGVSFRLSGILAFFYQDNSVAPSSALRPENLKVSLFEGNDFDVDKVLIFRSPFKGQYSSHNSLAENFSLGLYQARALLFEISPVWVEKNKSYSVVVECPSGSLSHKIYGDAKMTGVKSFNSQTLVSTADANIRRPYFQLYSKNDGLVKVMPPTKTAPLSRPVIFVHALGGFSADFAEYTDLLKSSGWPSGYLLSFDYGLKDGNYNNYADLNDLIPRLAAAVATVSATFKVEGGDGKIDLVGYSSGAVLSRNYLVTNKLTPRVRRFISIAGAFRGSFLADLESGNDNFPRAAGEATSQLAKLFLPSLSSFNPLTLGRTPPSTIFKTQIISTSTRVAGFKKEDLPSSVSYYSLQGDIKAMSTQKLFKALVKSEGSLGDGAVLGSSTVDLPGLSSFSFLDSAIATRSVTKSSATVSASFLLPDFSKIKFFHSALLKAQEIKNKILDLLK